MTTTTITLPDPVMPDPVPIDRNAKRRAQAAAKRQAEQMYDAWETEKVAPLSRDEKVVIAHMRGWAHFGPLCRMCKIESHLANALNEVRR
jgi:hypothetical protein